MNSPIVVADLIQAQNNFNEVSYGTCFTETAEVIDEGKTHRGRIEIENWIEKAGNEYQAKIKPYAYDRKQQILKVEVTGIFPGGQIILNYHLEIENELIKALKITS